MTLIEQILTTFMLLVAVHFVCDYPLQGDFLAKAKANGPLRVWHLFGHSMIHAGGVYVVTGSLLIMIYELICHFIIDELKVRNITSFKFDQFLHIWCKINWVIIVYNKQIIGLF